MDMILALVVYIIHFIGHFEYAGFICPWITVNKFMENYFGVSSIPSILGWFYLSLDYSKYIYGQ